MGEGHSAGGGIRAGAQTAYMNAIRRQEGAACKQTTRGPPMSQPLSNDIAPARRTALQRIIGDRPGAVMLRLVLVSAFVGFLMSIFGVEVEALFAWVQRAIADVFDNSGHIMRQAITWTLTGAAVVIPIWIILRLMSAGRGRR